MVKAGGFLIQVVSNTGLTVCVGKGGNVGNSCILLFQKQISILESQSFLYLPQSWVEIQSICRRYFNVTLMAEFILTG